MPDENDIAPLGDFIPAKWPLPEWVRRWHLARAAGDNRLFPDQANGVRELHFWHGSPLGNEKLVGYPSGYDDLMRVVIHKLPTDRAHFVQPDEYQRNEAS